MCITVVDITTLCGIKGYSVHLWTVGWGLETESILGLPVLKQPTTGLSSFLPVSA